MTDLPIEITFEVLRHFEELDIAYMLVGSVASSLQGIARSTIDADVVVDLRAEHLDPLLRLLQGDFYVSATAAQEALRRRSMFNAIQFSSGFKVDIYVLGRRDFDRQEFARRRCYHSEGRPLWVATPEDLILSKLDWYRLGEQVSERQWRDVVGLFQVHRNTTESTPWRLVRGGCRRPKVTRGASRYRSRPTFARQSRHHNTKIRRECPSPGRPFRLPTDLF